jgi:hypothetical protein
MAKRRRREARQRAYKLAWEQYSELNATLYKSNPSGYFNMRLQSLILLLSTSDAVDEALEDGLSFGVLTLESSRRLEEEERLRYAALECSVLLHHAGETLFRLYLAHRIDGPCPWLEIVKLRDADVFRRQVDAFGSDKELVAERAVVARVFLGGETPADAGVDAAEGVWSDAVDALLLLMRWIARKLNGQADLYNAAKHGLIGVPESAGTLHLRSPDGQEIPIGGGPAVTFLHRDAQDRSNSRSDAELWRASTEYVRIDSDLAAIALIARAIDSLWSVARRKYCGAPGYVSLLSLEDAAVSLYASQFASGHMASGYTYTLPVRAREPGTGDRPPDIEATTYYLSLDIPPPDAAEAYERGHDRPMSSVLAELPLRPADVRRVSTSGRSLFPFSPPGSQSV